MRFLKLWWQIALEWLHECCMGYVLGRKPEQSANLRNLLQRKVEEEGNLESQNLMVDIGFEEMAALKHSLKIALHVYDALQNSRCFACRRSIPTEERRNIGLGLLSNMDSALVVSKP